MRRMPVAYDTRILRPTFPLFHPEANHWDMTKPESSLPVA